ncbi:hypothetical protein GCM10023150_12720 [Kangiella taiwanensis]|uniref:AFP-like domain-containing protein n=1 Tax=Kangiella taiwanensis TaxID=1079179 RepID=A0ABP8I0R2_9GAMM
MNLSEKIDEIVIATSNLPSDDPIEAFCHKYNIKIYRGDLDNVAQRFLNAAVFYNLDAVIRVNGDNLFVNTELVDDACEQIEKGFDFVSNVAGRTFPKGMSVEGIRTKIYQEYYEEFNSAEDYEHVMSFFYKNKQNLKTKFIKNISCPEAEGKQIAIDTQRDFLIASKVFENYGWNDYSIDLSRLMTEYNLQETQMSFVGQHGPLLIAEIGGNHEGDFEYAKKLTRLAIESDADYIKFQMYSGDTLVNPVESPDRFKHFKKFELSREQYIELAKTISDSGKRFMASIWNEEMLDWIDEYNTVYKIGSGDLLAWPLLKKIAERSKPMILSTGLATEQEVVDTVNYIRDCNPLYNDANYLAVMQCTSMYPIPNEAANLNVMPKLHRLTGATMGYSDHTEGTDALKLAVAKGAQVLEFHFTDKREGKEFRDHKVSLTKSETLDLIEYIKLVNVLNGSAVKEPVEIEIDNGHVESFRRAIYPTRDISKGTVIKESDLVILRPSHGLSSRYYDEIIGKTTNKDLKKGQKLKFDYFS